MRLTTILISLSLGGLGCASRHTSVNPDNDALAVDQKAAASRAYDPLGMEIRLVTDITQWSFRRISPDTRRVWVVAKITPDRNSGRGTIPGAYINGETGELVTPKGGQLFVNHEGSCQVIALLAGTLDKKDWAYRFEEPALLDQFGAVPPTIDHYYSPFWHNGGLVICSTEGSAGKGGRFNNVHLLPAKWESSASEAWGFCKKNRELLRPNLAVQNRAKLRKLLTNRNPLLAIEACRLLAQSDGLDKNFVEETLANTHGYKRAAFALLFIKHLRKEEVKSESRKLEDLIEKITSPEEIRQLALACLIALSDRSGNVSSRVAMQILKKVKCRSSAFKEDSARGKFLQRIFDMAGMRAWHNKAIDSKADKRERL